jgi:chromate transporter
MGRDRVDPERTPLLALASLFLKLGATAIGGPAVHIAMMHDEVVVRRQWLSEQHFLDLLGATNLIPGPNSTELAIHIGWQRRRWAGLVVAGVAFILPAMLVTGALGWAYTRFGSLPTVHWLLYGVKPVVLGVVLQAIAGLLPKAARSTPLRVLLGLALLLDALNVNELVVLFGAGLLALAHLRFAAHPNRGSGKALLLAPIVLPAAVAAVAAPITLSGLFWTFLKMGSLLFGSGYVLLAFLRADFVERLHWLSEAQLVDAVAVGQVTPGPVFTTATFIGYLLAGPKGALVATAGIFLPAFVFVAVSGPLVPKLRSSSNASAFLDGVNVGSLALMVVVTVRLGHAAMVDLPTTLLALGSATLLLRYKPNATWLIAVGAIAGWLAHVCGVAAGT